MRTVWILYKKDLHVMLRDRVGLVITFLMPLVLIYIFGTVFGGAGGGQTTAIPLAVVVEGESAATDRVLRALEAEPGLRVVRTVAGVDGEAEPLDRARARGLLEDNRVRHVLILPDPLVSGLPGQISLVYWFNPRQAMEGEVVQGLLQRAVFTQVPALLLDNLREAMEERFGDAFADDFLREQVEVASRFFSFELEEGLDDLREFWQRGFSLGEGGGEGGDEAAGGLLASVLDFQAEQVVGREIANPGPTRNIGGWAIMFLLFNAAGLATILFDEKRAGLFLRLLSGPARRHHILWSKYLFGMSLGLFQLLLMFFIGSLLYGIELLPHLPKLAVVSAVTAASCIAFGMLLASVSKTSVQASGLATFIILTMSAVGGAWFPTFLMPEFIQVLSTFTIVYWAIEAYLLVLWQQAGWAALVRPLGILILVTLAVLAVSLWRFSKGDLFR